MSLNNVTPGSKAPEVFNVVIEISANSAPVKYEVDKETGCVFVDRFLGTAMHYPVNYGYVPQTLSGDGDPVDVLVMTPSPAHRRGRALPRHRHPGDGRRVRYRRQGAGCAHTEAAARLR